MKRKKRLMSLVLNIQARVAQPRQVVDRERTGRCGNYSLRLLNSISAEGPIVNTFPEDCQKIHNFFAKNIPCSECRKQKGVCALTETMEDRGCELGSYIVEHKATVRAVAKKFGVSKSSVHKDVTSRLYWIDRSLYEQVRTVLEENKRERHLRGGAATREKYRRQHETE